MCWKEGERKLSEISKGNVSRAPLARHTLKSKEAKGLLTELGLRAHLGQEAEERQPGEGQMLGPAWKTRLSNLGYRWHVREKDCIGY